MFQFTGTKSDIVNCSDPQASARSPNPQGDDILQKQLYRTNDRFVFLHFKSVQNINGQSFVETTKMVDISSYRIEVPDWKIDDLKKRLSITRFPEDELENAGRDYGVPLADIKRLVTYWMEKFDWPKAQERLNQLPHFITNIQFDGFENLNVHFLHKRSSVENAIPLLFVHGWPGSFLEVTKIMDELSKGDGHPSFHIVAPSLPNYGFSEGSKKKGFAIEQYAETCNALMVKLGYSKYVTQGGDWG